MWLASNGPLKHRRYSRLATGAAWLALLLAPHVWAEDRIVLRNLEVIRGESVAALSVDGVQLADQRLVGWDEIERITVTSAPQAEADRLLQQVGGPLFRLRQRLTVGDYANLLEPAEQIERLFAGRTGYASLLVHQSLMWGRLAAGERERALLPYVECLANIGSDPKLAARLPGTRRSTIDNVGLCRELPPIWFDEAAARAVLPVVLQRVAAIPAARRPVALYLYCGTLAAAAGDKAMAQRMAAAIPDRGRGGHWRAILEMQQAASEGGRAAVTELAEFDRLLADDRSLALYWHAKLRLAQAGSGDSANQEARADALLQLLRIPAAYGSQQPEVAAAALHEVTLQLEPTRPVQAVRVRRELLEHYRRTYYGRAASASPPAAGEAGSADSAEP
ncbi:MAG: hypothetical protein KDB14_18105 [Planctomycetales bacterium]|nr:hypothetical protein [Planctomycetales bacterium]